MDSKHYTEYQILKTIGENSELSQRLISKQTGINVSSINFALKRLIQKGYVKITNMNKKRILYHLTPSGISQKGKLAYNFFLRNYNLFTDVRELIGVRLSEHNLKGKKIAIYGLNEITEILYLCIKNKGFDFAGVLELSPAVVGEEWIEGKVLSLESLSADHEVDYILDAELALPDITSLKVYPWDDFLKEKKKGLKRDCFSEESASFSLKVLGARDTVTGACILLEVNGKKILIDCGTFQGSREEAISKNNYFAFNPEEINYLFLTHAHIDHVGRVPQLIDRGFAGEILCHHATVDIYPLLLEDQFRIDDTMRYKTPKEELLEKVVEQSWGFEYNRWNQLTKGIRFRLLDAGHILGSSSIQFDVDGTYIVFSGDVGNKNTGIIRDPQTPDRADYLVLESTYGGRSHRAVDKVAQFKNILKKSTANEGKVLIPAFSLGRTQEVIYHLNEMVEKGEIENIPVFVDSPLGTKITDIYSRHRECFDQDTLKRLNDGDDPLDFEKLFPISSYRDSLKITNIEGAAIIIAGSGMCNGGRIVSHLANLIGEESTDIIFVGYQAKNTLGAKILENSKKENGYLLVKGKKIPIKASVHRIAGFSAHADHEGLINWVKSISHGPRVIYLNHGEEKGQSALKNGLEEVYEKSEVKIIGAATDEGHEQ